MLKCPCCSVPIKYLLAWFTAQSTYHLTITELEGKPTSLYVSNGNAPLPELDGFACPNCQNMLFKTEADAIEFLKGE
jgi:hypothetical protein